MELIRRHQPKPNILHLQCPATYSPKIYDGFHDYKTNNEYYNYTSRQKL